MFFLILETLITRRCITSPLRQTCCDCKANSSKIENLQVQKKKTESNEIKLIYAIWVSKKYFQEKGQEFAVELKCLTYVLLCFCLHFNTLRSKGDKKWKYQLTKLFIEHNENISIEIVHFAACYRLFARPIRQFFYLG